MKKASHLKIRVDMGVFLFILTGCTASMMWSQTEQRKSLVINGKEAMNGVIVIQGKTYVDVDTFARLTNGSVSYQGNHVILNLPQSTGHSLAPNPTPNQPTDTNALSREFIKSGIEEINLLREWASPVANAIQNGYPITDNWVAAYQGNATNGLHLASANMSTAADRDAYQLLANEFEAVREWSTNLVEARKSMNAAHYATSPGALAADPLSQKITKCGHFLSSMFASGSYQDDGSCH